MPAITVPRLGWSMEEGTFVRWLKADGERVEVGEPLFELEGEKSTEAVEAIDAGVLRTQGGPSPGATVRVGQTIGHVGDKSSLPDPVPVPVPPLKSGAGSGTGSDRASSPRARRAARERGIDWRALVGSGRNGRVRERDVRQGAAEGRLVPHSRPRKLIAARMVAGATQAAPVTLTARADVTGRLGAGSFLAMVMKAVALTLREHPALRSQWRDDGLFVPERIHVAFAVDAEAGLFAPVVRDVDRLCLAEIGNLCRNLAAQARSGTLSADDQRGAAFTVTNLGAYGVETFTPIIHLPQ